MRSKASPALLAAGTALVSACSGASVVRTHRASVGTLPDLQSSLQLWPDLNTVVTTSRASHTVERFTLSPPAHILALPLPRSESDQLALPSADAAYYVTASGFGYAVAKAAGGAATIDPLAVPGTIVSVAFAPSQGFLAMLDDQQNLVLATVNATGDVTGTWATTTQLPSKEWGVSSAMLADGTLLLATSGAHIAVVDVAASVAGQAWKEHDVAVTGASDMTWIGGVQGLTNDAALVLDANRLVLVDLKAGTVLDQKSLSSAQVLGLYRDLTPHVVSQTQDEVQTSMYDVTYVSAGAKLTTVSVKGAINQITSSLLDVPGGSLALCYDADMGESTPYNQDFDFYAARQINRFHVADGSAVDVSSVDSDVNAVLRPQGFLTVHPAALGKADVRAYGADPAVVTLESYDFPVDSQLDAP